MILTQDQLDLRKKHLGASESAAVLGESPWATANDVYWRKVCPEAIDDEDPTDAMRAGTRLEPAILDFAQEELGVAIARGFPTLVDPKGVILCCTPDGKVEGRNEGVEAKMSSQAGEWGEAGSEEIPSQYIIQCQQQMHVMGWDLVHVPVLLVAFRADWRMYCVHRNDDLIAEIVERCEGWWTDHVVARKPPEDSPPPESILKRLHRGSGSRVILGENGIKLVAEWEAAKAVEKEAENKAEYAKRRVLELFGVEEPAEEAQLLDGRMLTFYSQRSSPSFESKRLRADHPALHRKYTKQGSHRCLRIKKAPKI